MTSRTVRVKVALHQDSERRTLQEWDSGASAWVDIKANHLFGNLDAKDFYRRVARRLANHAKNGVIVTEYDDGNEPDNL